MEWRWQRGSAEVLGLPFASHKSASDCLPRKSNQSQVWKLCLPTIKWNMNHTAPQTDPRCGLACSSDRKLLHSIIKCLILGVLPKWGKLLKGSVLVHSIHSFEPSERGRHMACGRWNVPEPDGMWHAATRCAHTQIHTAKHTSTRPAIAAHNGSFRFVFLPSFFIIASTCWHFLLLFAFLLPFLDIRFGSRRPSDKSEPLSSLVVIVGGWLVDPGSLLRLVRLEEPHPQNCPKCACLCCCCFPPSANDF